MSLSLAHGQETGLQLAALQQLMLAEYRHHPGCVPFAQHDGLRREDVRLHHLQ
jgi:hypothetical protein